VPVQIGAKLDSGFDDPIGMLQDCHRRIERFLSVLCRVAERRETGALTGAEMQSVESALNYFRKGGQRHNADEEESLFPRLRQSAGEEMAAIAELEEEHREAASLHATVEQLYSAWMARGELSEGERQRLRLSTARLARLYAGHIAVEETRVFPLARRLRDRETIAAVGSEFRTRRALPVA
jgi:hemerythrin-like domain-containing protein